MLFFSLHVPKQKAEKKEKTFPTKAAILWRKTLI